LFGGQNKFLKRVFSCRVQWNQFADCESFLLRSQLFLVVRQRDPAADMFRCDEKRKEKKQ